jgi:hypothetical protein
MNPPQAGFSFLPNLRLDFIRKSEKRNEKTKDININLNTNTLYKSLQFFLN